MTNRIPVLMPLVVLAACPLTARGPRYAQIDPLAIRSVDLVVVGGGTTFCPSGEPPQLRAVARTADGKRLDTWSDGESREGRLDFAAFEWSASAGTVDGEGHYRAPRDPFAVVDRQVTIRARVAGNPQVAAELLVSPTFDCGGALGYSGEAGAGGPRGDFGRQGRSGDSGDKDRNATDGEHGEAGGDGGDGGNGGHAPNVEVALGLVDTEKHGPLVLARVMPEGAPGYTSYVLLTPTARPLFISAHGGPGGSGGGGGSGGNGGSGGSNNASEGGDGGNGGDGGPGGRGGGGGDGGDGGAITVRYDASHPELVERIRIDNGGGGGGSPGSQGFGGSGGSGGSSSKGQRGRDGRSGMSGQAGTRFGRDGRPGPPPRFVAEDRGSIFAAEIRAGVRLR